MAETNDINQINGLLKKVYLDGPATRLAPNNMVLQKRIKMDAQAKLGDKLEFPVVVQRPQGISYGGPSDDGQALPTPIAGVIERAQIDSYSMAMKNLLGWNIVLRAKKQGKQAFANAVTEVVDNALLSLKHRLEVSLLYGSAGLGTVASVSAPAVTISEATFAPGIWAGIEGASIEFRDSSGVLQQTCTVVSANIANGSREVTLDDATNVSANDVAYFAGSYGKDMAGIHSVLNNTSTLYNISTSTYPLWKGNTYAVGGALTREKLGNAFAEALNKGSNSDMLVMVHPLVWDDLAETINASIRYDGAKGEAVYGHKNLVIQGHNSRWEIVGSPMVKKGDGFMLDTKTWCRVGPSDVTLGSPGDHDQLIRQSSSNEALEFVAHSNQTIFCKRPGYNVYLSGITT